MTKTLIHSILVLEAFSMNPNREPKESELDKPSDTQNLLRKSALYKEFLAERGEILKHKWIESEKAGYDIGFERALLDWIVKYRTSWRKNRKTSHTST